nr:G-type lectin S-receptor-like serine/threonine-protein kinase At1g67520 [Tanacetum cinerariifolium]
ARPCNPTSYGELFNLVCPKSVTYEYDTFNRVISSRGGNYTVSFCDTFSTIKLGDGQLTYNDQLVSVNGNFTLGFFEDHAYLGIWYTRDDQSRKVWVANPNAPVVANPNDVSNTPQALSIDPNTGNLIITNGNRTLMKITNVDAGPNPDVTATLEDNGNIRLINAIDKKVLWQSFDYPTNVLLPGMKLGYDITTGQNWTLTSWLSNEIPDAGTFTLSWEPVNKSSYKLLIRRRGRPYWSTEILGNQTFQNIFTRGGFKLTSVYNDKDRYISYNIAGHDLGNDDGNVSFPMLTLTPEGQIISAYSSLWVPMFCYGFASRTGCLEDSSVPRCRKENHIFSYRNGAFAPDKTRYATDSSLSLSISDCFAMCWNDCSCVGYNSSNTEGTGCIFWRGSNTFSDDPTESSAWMYVISSQNRSTGIKTKIKTELIMILIGFFIPLVSLRFGLLWCLKKREQRKEEEERRKRDEYFIELTSSESFKDVHNLESSGGKGNDLLIFSFASIMAATNDFSLENKLGEGGFGPVYKGNLDDGQEIAIKRLSKTSGQGLLEFKNELILIAKLQHTNLVRVLGCCIYREEKMLIYEYMPNKSLDFFLFDDNRKVELDWPKRFNIIEGIAQGLLYLHKYSRMCVIHRDLKVSNILLDERMNPRIADFGMARMFKQNETQAMTNRVVGTFGYMSPEYIREGTFSIKSDIFSFGVLILETVSGRKNSSFVHLDRTYNLIGYAWELWQQENALELVDPTLGNTCVLKQFLRTVHVALLCAQESATDRPTTSDMISMLLNDTVPLPAPKKPAFFISRDESRQEVITGKAKKKVLSVLGVKSMSTVSFLIIWMYVNKLVYGEDDERKMDEIKLCLAHDLQIYSLQLKIKSYGSCMSSCNKRKNDSYTLTSSPNKRHQMESSRTDMETDVNMDRSSDTEMAEQEDSVDKDDKLRSISRKEEIQILNQMIAFNNKYHRFPDSGCEHDVKEFCTSWLKISVDCHDVLLDKMRELHARFKKNYNKFDNEFPPMWAWIS